MKDLKRSSIPILGMITIGLLPSFLKKLYYRIKGAQIGKNVHLGICSYIKSPKIVLADGSKVSPFSFIVARRAFHLGKRSKIGTMVAIDTSEVYIGNDSVLMEQVVVGGMLTPRSVFKVGDRVKIFPYCFINPTEPITIEDDVGVGGANYLFTHGSWPNVLEGYPYAFGPITIKKNAWLQWRIFITPRVTIGENAVIGADSTVTKSIPDKALAAGSPAKVIKQGDDFVKPWTEEQKHEMMKKFMTEYHEYLVFLGLKLDLIDKDESIQIKESGHNLIQYVRKTSSGEFSLLSISLNEIEDTTRQEIAARSGAWFDLARLESNIIKNPVWEETKNFLSRFGIRCKVID